MNELFYRCERCGNIVVLIKSGGGTLSCCGQGMTKLIANSVDASNEKHVPVTRQEDDKIIVSVGLVPHPMSTEHFIEWIALVTGGKIEIIHLMPGMEPKSEFTCYSEENKVPFSGKNEEDVPNCEGQPCNFVISEKLNEVYAYCNLHGLWKTEL